jgi:two-component system, NarL family, sensor histidine kinase UhpB
MRKPHSVRSYIVGLIVVVLLPFLAFSSFLVIRFAQHEQEVTAATVRYRTRLATAVIDDQISTLRSRLFVLAGGLSLETSDLVDFHARAKDAFRDPDMTVVLSNATGQEILNTGLAVDESPPDSPDRAAIRRVAETSRPYVSDMTIDPITDRPAVNISVPVTRDSRLVYVLSLDIASALPRLLEQADLPGGWIATISDRQGYTIARNRSAELYVGQLARKAFIDQVQAAEEGSLDGISREGIPLYSAFSHTRLGGWTVTIGIPRDTLFAPVRETRNGLILLGGATLVLAIALAIAIGRRIAKPMVELVPVAESVGRGDRPALRLSWLIEANAVARSLFEADRRLQQAASEREQALGALRQSEQQYRVLAEDLGRANEERTELLHRILAAQEDERKRIARELHDSLAQYLTALRLRLDAHGQFDIGNGAALQSLAVLKSLTGELDRAVNRMAWDLRPVPLEELGLRAAVVHYLEEWAERANLQVDVEVKLGDSRVPPVVEGTLFRVLQEATTNVLKHADANRVAVILEASEAELRLIIEDDGKGFVCGETGEAGVGKKRLGILGIRERLALVRGSLEVESAPDDGTTLFVRIPVGDQR